MNQMPKLYIMSCIISNVGWIPLLQRKLRKRQQVPQILKYIHVIVCFIGLQSPVVTVARDPVL